MEYYEDENEDEYDNDHEDEAYLCDENKCTMPALDNCQECGAALCHMHSEIQCGFCSNCPTENFQGYE